nr:MAG TPA: protein of unknown function (DUF4153) [Caudoviricetes sp.]DAS77631.1 MAG TPA: protein of unknown function (DUF4153) [Caudoviricetes sp.]
MCPIVLYVSLIILFLIIEEYGWTSKRLVGR